MFLELSPDREPESAIKWQGKLTSTGCESHIEVELAIALLAAEVVGVDQELLVLGQRATLPCHQKAHDNFASCSLLHTHCTEIHQSQACECVRCLSISDQRRLA